MLGLIVGLVRRRKPEMIIRESQPIELPPDVVRGISKQLSILLVLIETQFKLLINLLFYRVRFCFFVLKHLFFFTLNLIHPLVDSFNVFIPALILE